MQVLRSKFEENPELERRVQQLIAFTAEFAAGHILMRDDVERLLGVAWDSQESRQAVAKWRKHMLRVRKIETWGLRDVGVKLLTAGEHFTVIAVKRAKRAYKQHGKILRAMNTTLDAEVLTEHQMRMRAAIVEHSRSARAQTNKVSNTLRGKIPNDRAALIERAKRAAGQQ